MRGLRGTLYHRSVTLLVHVQRERTSVIDRLRHHVRSCSAVQRSDRSLATTSPASDQQIRPVRRPATRRTSRACSIISSTLRDAAGDTSWVLIALRLYCGSLSVSWHTVLCCTTLCRMAHGAALCYDVLRCAMLRYGALHCIALSCALRQYRIRHSRYVTVIRSCIDDSHRCRSRLLSHSFSHSLFFADV